MRAFPSLLLCALILVGCDNTIVTPTYPPTRPPSTALSEAEAPITRIVPTQTPQPSLTPSQTPTFTPTATSTAPPTPVVLTLKPPSHIEPDGLRTLGLVNAWRVGIGLWPLAPNAELSALAQAQADYLNSLGDWPPNIHMDANGGMAPDRAKAAGWPAYDDARTAFAVTEIIATGATPQEAVDWWRGSEIHTWVIEAAYYREAGVGVVERPWGGKTYVIVVGSRPNILPALFDPLDHMLYVTDELYGGGYNGILYDAQQVQFLPDINATPDASAWQPHTVSYRMVHAPAAVVYLGTGGQVTMPVNRIAWLPDVVSTALEK